MSATGRNKIEIRVEMIFGKKPIGELLKTAGWRIIAIAAALSFGVVWAGKVHYPIEPRILWLAFIAVVSCLLCVAARKSLGLPGDGQEGFLCAGASILLGFLAVRLGQCMSVMHAFLPFEYPGGVGLVADPYEVVRELRDFTGRAAVGVGAWGVLSCRPIWVSAAVLAVVSACAFSAVSAY